MLKKPNKGQTMFMEEAKVRGLCTAYSADIDTLLLRVISYCIIDYTSNHEKLRVIIRAFD